LHKYSQQQCPGVAGASQSGQQEARYRSGLFAVRQLPVTQSHKQESDCDITNVTNVVVSLTWWLLADLFRRGQKSESDPQGNGAN
jgi:hypothetical protein